MAVAYLFSNDRRAIQPRVIYWGLGLQFGFAFLVLKTPLADVFTRLSNVINHVLGYSIEGSKFVFGDKLGAPNDQFGVVFAFQVLPIIIFIASLFAILYYLGVMQIFVQRHGAWSCKESWAPAARNPPAWRPASSWARPKRP